ncbi:MAG: LysR family transcriptional regulator, glycine cleavage system transcriptional activator [Pseudomonadota bacterium]|jgi:LysR family glycine cleavage system transcriptional activator|nr:LysR family transcriptional regulator, glycine cleavage system transcriptional activator [Pseudomonadota bacterium]
MLRGLQAFEAVARHGSYPGAAQELGVTPAAIGQQVRSLEAWTGAVLFQRLGSGSQRLVPTPTARSALPQLESGLDQIALALGQLRRPSDHLVLTASQAFVSGWLLPRLDRLSASHPQLGVRLDTRDAPADIARGQADLGICLGRPEDWPTLTSRRLMGEDMVAVCHPRWVSSPRSDRDTGELPGDLTLIHDTTPDAPGDTPSWAQWLGRQSLSSRQRRHLQIDSTAAVIQAALDGHGAALTRRALVAHHLQAGRLTHLAPQVRWPLSCSYHLVHRPGEAEAPHLQPLVGWLEQQAAAGA